MTILIKPEQMAESAKIGTDIRHKIHEEPELGLCSVSYTHLTLPTN